MTKTIFIFVFLLTTSTIFAHGGSEIKSYDNFLKATEMSSFEDFKKVVEKRRDKLCVVLDRQYKKSKHDYSVKRRVIVFYGLSDCAGREKVIKENLISRDDLLVIAALNALIMGEGKRSLYQTELDTVAERFKSDQRIQKMVSEVR